MEKLDLAILIDNSSWTLKSFIYAGGDKLQQSLENELRKLDADFRVACVQYGYLNQQTAHDSHTAVHGFCTNVPVSFLEQFVGSDDALTTAIEKTCDLDWRNDARKICFVITDNPPLALSADSRHQVDILGLTRKLGGKGVVLNIIGIEPRLKPYRDFFMTLSYITGGRYIALTDPSKLATVIVGAAQEDISLEKILHLVNQKAVDCIHNIGPSENDIGQFYNGCDQHFIDIYKEMEVDGKPPVTIHFRDSNYKHVFVTPLARYLSTLPSLDVLKKKCPSWPLPWPVQYHLPHRVPHYCRPGPPHPPVRRFAPPQPSASSVSTSEMTARNPPAPPPPPLPQASSAAESNDKLSCSVPTSKSGIPSSSIPTSKSSKLSSKFTKSSTASSRTVTPRQPSTAPPPPLVKVKAQSPAPPPPPQTNLSFSDVLWIPPPPPPPPRPERRLPLRMQWPPNPREMPDPDGSSVDSYEMNDAAGRTAMPFDGGFCFRLQTFSTLRAPPTYGQLHRLVQRALVRGLFKPAK